MERTLFAALEAAQAARRARESTWTALAEFVHPVADRFSAGPRGQKAARMLYDSTALVAAEQLAAALFALVSDPALRWFRIEGSHPAWQASAEAELRQSIGEGGQALLTQISEALRDLVVFGTAALQVGETGDAEGLQFTSVPLDQLLLSAYGGQELGLRARLLTLDRASAVQRWPEVYDKALDGNSPSSRDSGLRAQAAGRPEGLRGDDAEQRLSVTQLALFEPQIDRRKPWRVVWLDSQRRLLLSETREASSPLQVVRWSSSGHDAWGEGLGALVLADVKTLNLMVKLNLTAAQKAVDPPLLANEELGMRAIKTQPGALIYGALDREGRRLIEPFVTGEQVPLGLDMEAQKRNQIRSVFMAPLSLLSNEGGTRTATEILAGREERAWQFAPVLNRIQGELFTPILQRALSLLVRQGKVPLPPEVPRFHFLNSFSQARRAQAAQRTLAALDTLKPLIEAVPDMAARLDLEGAFYEVAAGLGAPLKTSAAAEAAASGEARP